MSLSTLKNHINRRNLDVQDKLFLSQDSYITVLVDYFTNLYRSGEISQNTCEYLIRTIYSQRIEQMIEEKIENKLNKLIVQLNQKSSEMSIAELFL